MAEVLTIAGSPSTSSKSAFLLRYAAEVLQQNSIKVNHLAVRELPAEDLVFARLDSPILKESFSLVEQAQGIVVATPIYKAAYSGVLKSYLDLVPQNAFAGKVILPIATGGSPAHFLALDYALKPVLAALGATHILSGVYLQDSQFQTVDGQVKLADEIAGRYQLALQDLASKL